MRGQEGGESPEGGQGEMPTSSFYETVIPSLLQPRWAQLRRVQVANAQEGHPRQESPPSIRLCQESVWSALRRGCPQ